MMERYEALDAEAINLRQQLSAATLRSSELSLQNEQLLKSLERYKGTLALVSVVLSGGTGTLHDAGLRGWEGCVVQV